MGKCYGRATGQYGRYTDVKRRTLVKNGLACWIPLNYKKLEDIKL